MRSKSNNAKGNEQVSGIAWYYGNTDFIYTNRISLHVPQPVNVANARYHSLLGDNIFIWCFQPIALVRQTKNAGVIRSAYEA